MSFKTTNWKYQHDNTIFRYFYSKPNNSYLFIREDNKQTTECRSFQEFETGSAYYTEKVDFFQQVIGD